MSDTNTPAETVIEAIATAENVDPASMTPVLATAIDPDALNRLVDHGSDDPAHALEIAFTYRGREIVVDERGTVDLH